MGSGMAGYGASEGETMQAAAWSRLQLPGGKVELRICARMISRCNKFSQTDGQCLSAWMLKEHLRGVLELCCKQSQAFKRGEKHRNGGTVSTLELED